MNYFWEIVETIESGVGFNYFDSLHLSWIFGYIVFAIVNSLIYRKCNSDNRNRMRKVFVILILLDEFLKHFGLITHGNWTVHDLPFHLCSINIIIVTYHCFKPNTTIDNFLYAVCIPSATAAVLFPTWTSLPLLNFLHIHSFSIHILLATYTIMNVAGGDIVPDIKLVAKAIIFTCILAMPVYGVNLLLNTNFMFLMGVEEGNPLMFFQDVFGVHLIGVPMIESVIIFILYTPFYVYRALKPTKQIEVNEDFQ